MKNKFKEILITILKSILIIISILDILFTIKCWIYYDKDEKLLPKNYDIRYFYVFCVLSIITLILNVWGLIINNLALIWYASISMLSCLMLAIPGEAEMMQMYFYTGIMIYSTLFGCILHYKTKITKCVHSSKENNA